MTAKESDGVAIRAQCQNAKAKMQKPQDKRQKPKDKLPKAKRQKPKAKGKSQNFRASGGEEEHPKSGLTNQPLASTTGG